MKKILLFGAQGQLGMEIFNNFQNNYNIIPFSRFNLDLTDNTKIKKLIVEIKPDIVINCAAYTNTERAENPKLHKLVELINTTAPGEMAKACEIVGAKLIHFSTDFVFDGNPNLKFTENSPKKPLNYYGLSKSKGEDLVQEFCSNYIIIRSAWLFGKYGPNIINKIIKMAKKQSTLKIADDLIVSATSTKDLANATMALIDNPDIESGIYHLINEGEYSLFNIAKMIFQIKNIQKELLPVSFKEFSDQIHRPPRAILINTKLPKLRPLPDALTEYLHGGH